MQCTQVLLCLAAATAALMLHGCSQAAVANIQASINEPAGNLCAASVSKIVDATKPLLIQQVEDACLNLSDGDLPDPSTALSGGTFNPKEKCTTVGTAKIDSVFNTTEYIALCSAFTAGLETTAEAAWENANFDEIKETWTTAFASLMAAQVAELADSIQQAKEFCVLPQEGLWDGADNTAGSIWSNSVCSGTAVPAGTECLVTAAAGQTCTSPGLCQAGTGYFENAGNAGCTPNACSDLLGLASLVYPCTCGTSVCTTGQSCMALTNTCTAAATEAPTEAPTEAATARLFTINDDNNTPKAPSGYPVQVFLLTGAAGVALVTMVAFAVSRKSAAARALVNGEVLDVEMHHNEALD